MQKIIYIIIFTLCTVVVLSTNTYAATEYDNVINKTDTLLLENDVSNKSLDITQSYLENLRQCSESEYDNLMSVINNSGSWAISIYNTNGHPTWDGSKNIVAIYWASTIRPDYTLKITFGLNPNEAGGKAALVAYDHVATLRLKSNDLLDCQAGGTDPIANGYWGSPISTEVQNQPGSTKVFLATYPVEYPENYEGQPIPATFIPKSNLSVSYTIDTNSMLKAKFNQTKTVNSAKYQLYDNSNNLLDEKILSFDQTYIFQLTLNNTYKLKVSPEPLENDENLQSVEFNFTPNGAMQSGSTATSTCDSNGVCTPNPNEITPFSDVKIETHGLLGIITAPVALYQYIQNASDDNCTPLHINLIYQITQASPSSNPSALASPEPLTLPCMSSFYKSTIDKSGIFGYPNFFQIYQTITFGVVAYYVGLQLLRIVKNAKDPKHDKIETTEL